MANTVKRVLNIEDGVDEVVAPHCGGGVLGEDPEISVESYHVVRVRSLSFVGDFITDSLKTLKTRVCAILLDFDSLYIDKNSEFLR